MATRFLVESLRCVGVSGAGRQGAGCLGKVKAGAYILRRPRGRAAALLQVVSCPHFVTSLQEKLRKASLCRFSTISSMHGFHFYDWSVFSGYSLGQQGPRKKHAYWFENNAGTFRSSFSPCVFSMLHNFVR